LEDELTAAGMTDGGAIRVRKLSYVEPVRHRRVASRPPASIATLARTSSADAQPQVHEASSLLLQAAPAAGLDGEADAGSVPSTVRSNLPASLLSLHVIQHEARTALNAVSQTSDCRDR